MIIMMSLELFTLYKSGFRPIVEFKDGIEEQECFDPGMKAKLISMNEEDDWGYCCVFDFSDYEDYNKAFEIPVWFGNNGEKLKWSETSYYPNDKKAKVYIGKDNVELFVIVDEHEAYADYRKSRSPLTYLMWLEEQYLKNKTKP